MAVQRTVMAPDGNVITVDVADQTVMAPSGAVINATIEAPATGGRIMSSLTGHGGLAGHGGIAGMGGGLAG
jgi:hypothetical protein